MDPVHFTIDERVFSSFPDAHVFAVRACGVRKRLAEKDIKVLLTEAIALLTISPDNVADHPSVSRWRAAYAAMGAKPSKFRSSIEALLRRVAKGGDILLQVPTVNFYNACSIRHQAPVGAYDVGKLPSRNITLRPADPQHDQFKPLGASPETFPLSTGLIIYADGNEVLCWGFNCRDSKVAALDESSDDVLFFSEAAFLDQAGASFAVVDAIRSLLLRSCIVCSPVTSATASAPTFELL